MPGSAGVSIDKTGVGIGKLQIELQNGRASKIMDSILEARMHDRAEDGSKYLFSHFQTLFFF